MITLLSLISLITIFYWMRLWDRAVKSRLSIRYYIPPESDPIGLMALLVPTVITIISIIFFMVTYLP